MTLKHVNTTGKIVRMGATSVGVLLPRLIKEMMEIDVGTQVKIVFDSKSEAIVITK